jgi:predicted dehydrogenase
MGRAHTHAYTDVPIFFNPDIKIVKKTICANEESVKDIYADWGFQGYALDWRELIDDDKIDIVDIAAPSLLHADIAIAAAKAGKHVFCEKPLALTLEDAKRMTEAAAKADVVNMIGFNYRRVPALALAKQLIDEGRIGEVYHFRGIYEQSWLIDPGFPLAWRLVKSQAGYGTHGDMGAHVIDIARFLVGEIDSVLCRQKTFIKERPLPLKSDGLVAIAGDEMGKVDVDDASAMMLSFAGKDTMGYIEVTRYGTGHRNKNCIEINGSKGAIIFDMEKMNELQFYSVDDDVHVRGFRRIQVGEGAHPYMANWWPAGHIIGYGDTFVNQTFDFITAIAKGDKVKPDFEDGYMCQCVLEAAQVSSVDNQWVSVRDIEQEVK